MKANRQFLVSRLAPPWAGTAIEGKQAISLIGSSVKAVPNNEAVWQCVRPMVDLGAAEARLMALALYLGALAAHLAAVGVNLDALALHLRAVGAHLAALAKPVLWRRILLLWQCVWVP